MADPGPETRASAAFPATRWSLVARAGAAGSANGADLAAAREALAALLRRYLPALEAHLLQRRTPPQRVADLLQGFISDKILEQNLLARADQLKGKFRTFLLTALQNYVVDVARQEQSLKRSPSGGPPLSLEDAGEPAVDAAAAEAFDIAWARQLLAECVRRMKAECEAAARADVWGVFEARVLLPATAGTEPVGYDALVARFGFKSPVQAANVLITAKRMFARVLRETVGEYAEGEAEVEQEIRDLHEVLAAYRGE